MGGAPGGGGRGLPVTPFVYTSIYSSGQQGKCKPKVIGPDKNICSENKYSNEGGLEGGAGSLEGEEEGNARHLQLKWKAVLRSSITISSSSHTHAEETHSFTRAATSFLLFFFLNE